MLYLFTKEGKRMRSMIIGISVNTDGTLFSLVLMQPIKKELSPDKVKIIP